MNKPNDKPVHLPTVLMAEDDSDDRFIMDDAFKRVRCRGELRFVGDGEELMEYLGRWGRFANPELSPRPSLILLDLNMPKKDGRHALEEIKADPALADIPIIIWTTSGLAEDKTLCLKAGANAFLTKPESYDDLKNIVEEICNKWLGV